MEPEKMHIKESERFLQSFNSSNFIETIVKYMELAEGFISCSGVGKKAYVLGNVKELLGEDTYFEYADFIIQFIDFTIQVSRKDVILKLNRIKKEILLLLIYHNIYFHKIFLILQRKPYYFS
jgi:Na+-translocating ferredoxin:NAD+ oxidoreductase RnfE subunit